METVNPTRMNLLLKREESNVASIGAELLRNKRDVLLREFFSNLKTLIALRGMLDNQASEALRCLLFALGLEGKEKLSSFSFIKPKAPSIKVNYKNLLGLKIPEIIIEPQEDGNDSPPNEIDASLLIAETKKEFQDFLNLALRTLPQELKIRRLGQEIKNTTRKVNSLEKFVIPQLYSHIKFIVEVLEEREREDIFRLKRLKKHLIQGGVGDV